MAKSKFMAWIIKACVNLFGRNYWGWAHLTFSALACSIYFVFFPHNWEFASILWAGRIVVGLAIFWEMIEFIVEIKMAGKKVADVYGSVKHWWQDTLGDIILAIIGFGIALI